ncbi:Cell division protein ftsj, partial [Daphnia magna]
FQGHNVNFYSYEHLLEAQKGLQLMLCCRLTEAHVKPNNFQKMNVRLVAQLFSERNALAFKIYREMPAFTANEKRLKKY